MDRHQLVVARQLVAESEAIQLLRVRASERQPPETKPNTTGQSLATRQHPPPKSVIRNTPEIPACRQAGVQSATSRVRIFVYSISYAAGIHLPKKRANLILCLLPILDELQPTYARLLYPNFLRFPVHASLGPKVCPDVLLLRLDRLL